MYKHVVQVEEYAPQEEPLYAPRVNPIIIQVEEYAHQLESRCAPRVNPIIIQVEEYAPQIEPSYVPRVKPIVGKIIIGATAILDFSLQKNLLLTYNFLIKPIITITVLPDFESLKLPNVINSKFFKINALEYWFLQNFLQKSAFPCSPY